MKQQLKKLFKPSSYPGRGLILAMTKSGDRAAAYFITGRSKQSRARRLSPCPDGIFVEALDSSLLEDKLRVYHPIRKKEGTLIVTNGSQTDLFFDALGDRDEFIAFRSVMEKLEFEPDPPLFTPRISGLIKADGSYIIGIVSRFEKECYEYAPMPGIGHMIYTYEGERDNPVSFRGSPGAIAVPDSAEELSDALWESLSPELRVSLYVSYKSMSSGEESEIIYNKY